MAPIKAVGDLSRPSTGAWLGPLHRWFERSYTVVIRLSSAHDLRERLIQS